MDTTVASSTTVIETDQKARSGFAERSSRSKTSPDIGDIDKMISIYSSMHGLIGRVKKRISSALNVIEEYRFLNLRSVAIPACQVFGEVYDDVLEHLQTSLSLIGHAYTKMHACLKDLKLAYLLSSGGAKVRSSAYVFSHHAEFLKAVDPLVYPTRIDANGTLANESKEERDLRGITSLVRKGIAFEGTVPDDSDCAYECYVFENLSKRLAYQPLHDIFPLLKETMDALCCSANDSSSYDVIAMSLFMRLSLRGTDRTSVFQLPLSPNDMGTQRNKRIRYHIRTTQSDLKSETGKDAKNEEVHTCECNYIPETFSKMIAYAIAFMCGGNVEVEYYDDVGSSSDSSSG